MVYRYMSNRKEREGRYMSNRKEREGSGRYMSNRKEREGSGCTHMKALLLGFHMPYRM